MAFLVEESEIRAHKLVIAARAPALHEAVVATNNNNSKEDDHAAAMVRVDDMKAAVFKAVLHFIYTDSLPAMVDPGRDDYKEIVMHLFVAADRYAMERLKIICESILCENIDAKTVVTTFALAYQHRCGRLNDTCIQFIASLSTMETNDLMASQGYAHLKRSCPDLIVDVFERTVKSRKI